MKRQSLEWKTPGSPRSLKARRSKSQVKTMLIAFFDSQGLIHHEFVPQGQTVINIIIINFVTQCLNLI